MSKAKCCHRDAGEDDAENASHTTTKVAAAIVLPRPEGLDRGSLGNFLKSFYTSPPLLARQLLHCKAYIMSVTLLSVFVAAFAAVAAASVTTRPRPSHHLRSSGDRPASLSSSATVDRLPTGRNNNPWTGSAALLSHALPSTATPANSAGRSSRRRRDDPAVSTKPSRHLRRLYHPDEWR